jgi:hypothetical protein
MLVPLTSPSRFIAAYRLLSPSFLFTSYLCFHDCKYFPSSTAFTFILMFSNVQLLCLCHGGQGYPPQYLGSWSNWPLGDTDLNTMEFSRAPPEEWFDGLVVKPSSTLTKIATMNCSDVERWYVLSRLEGQSAYIALSAHAQALPCPALALEFLSVLTECGSLLAYFMGAYSGVHGACAFAVWRIAHVRSAYRST